MTPSRALLAGLGAGGAGMYFLDPERGGRRRSLVRDQLVRWSGETSDAAGTAARDLANRTRGAAEEVRRAMRREAPSDETIAERVRARMGTSVSHPRAIAVRVQQGIVSLRGPVL